MGWGFQEDWGADRQDMIYFIRNVETGSIKIGYSANPRKRMASLGTGSDGKLELWATIPGTIQQEKVLHRKHARYRVRPNSEWFKPHPEFITAIAALIEEARLAEIRRAEAMARMPRLLGVPIESVYLAGKITGNSWRLQIIPTWNQMGLDTDGDHWEPGVCRSSVPLPCGHRLDYRGPFFVELNDSRQSLAFRHKSPIGSGPHASADRFDHTGCWVDAANVVQRCRKQIRISDLFFAWIDSTSCYGTLAEIGYAAGIGRSWDRKQNQVIVVACDSLDQDLWFASYLADIVIEGAKCPAEAWERLWSGEYSPAPEAEESDVPIGLAARDYFSDYYDPDYEEFLREQEQADREYETTSGVMHLIYGDESVAGIDYGLTLDDYC